MPLSVVNTTIAKPKLRRTTFSRGGIHLVDNSSVGKSTAIKAAASVWGGPKYVRSWNTTSNGLEGAAALSILDPETEHSSKPLILLARPRGFEPLLPP